MKSYVSFLIKMCEMLLNNILHYTTFTQKRQLEVTGFVSSVFENVPK
jgi:hypothetical protein